MLSSLPTPTAQAVVLRHAQRRGIPQNKINELLNPSLGTRHTLVDADKASLRLQTAIKSNERVVIFGECDADGLTSVSILLRSFRECPSLHPVWALPNRQPDNYGLDLEGARKLVAGHLPTLLIAVVNSTNAAQALAWLCEQGVNTVVTDPPPAVTLARETVAIINPEAHPAVQRGDLKEISVAGLSLLIGHHLAGAWACTAQWDYPGP